MNIKITYSVMFCKYVTKILNTELQIANLISTISPFIIHLHQPQSFLSFHSSSSSAVEIYLKIISCKVICITFVILQRKPFSLSPFPSWALISRNNGINMKLVGQFLFANGKIMNWSSCVQIVNLCQRNKTRERDGGTFIYCKFNDERHNATCIRKR